MEAHWVSSDSLALGATKQYGVGFKNASCDGSGWEVVAERKYRNQRNSCWWKEKGGKRGRGAGNKSIVLIAVDVHEPMGFGRVRMQRISDASGESLIPFACKNVEPGSVVITDCWKGCSLLKTHGYTHKKINISQRGDPAHVHLPGVHRIASLLKRWLLGMHQGVVRPEHLDYYLDEYTFRFNAELQRLVECYFIDF